MAFLSSSGWTRDIPDQRDFKYLAPKKVSMPSSLDLSKHKAMPPVYDQLTLGSCTAFSVGSIVQFERREVNRPNDFLPSWLFVYYNTRVMENTVSSDSGAQIRNTVKSVTKYGVCPDRIWPYKESRFAVRPPPNAFSTGKNFIAIRYERVERSLNSFKTCLLNQNLIAFGFAVYSSFLSDSVAYTGIVPIPDPDESMEGGHAVVAVGYDDSKKSFLVRNSWGKNWGLKGYFWMPYDYLLRSDLSADFWTISAIKS